MLTEREEHELDCTKAGYSSKYLAKVKVESEVAVFSVTAPQDLALTVMSKKFKGLKIHCT